MSKKLKPGVKSIRLEQAGSTVKYGQSARRETEVSLPRSGLVLICIFFFFWWNLGLNSELRVCKTGALLLEPHFQSILFWLFLEMGFCKLFAQTGLKL
jgi:hypothetical protein